VNGQLDGTIRQRLLGDSVALPASFDLRFFDGVGLHQPIQFALLSPAACKVVKPNLCQGEPRVSTLGFSEEPAG
jgi:hypothetical protein